MDLPTKQILIKFRRAAKLIYYRMVMQALLDEAVSCCNVSVAWRKIPQQRRQAICSLKSRKLPLCNPLHGDWNMAERYLFLAFPRPHNPLSPDCCKNFSPKSQSSSSRKI